MYKFIAPAIALGMALTAGMFLATDASAKGHAQGLTADPGSNVGTETVGNSQGEGAEQSGMNSNDGVAQGRGPADTPAGAEPGNSENAGRSGGSESGSDSRGQ